MAVKKKDHQKQIVVTVTGPSLTGKSTFAQLLEPYSFSELVSTTTRPPRIGEIDGKHYNFVSREEFQVMFKRGDMIEHVEVDKNFYGLSRKALKNVHSIGKHAVVVVEPHGAQQVSEFCEKNNIPVFKIFLNNPTETLVTRFLQRYKNDSMAKDETYARRVINMLSVEQETWINPAVNGTTHYDYVAPAFSKQNEHEVIEEIVHAVSQKLEILNGITDNRQTRMRLP